MCHLSSAASERILTISLRVSRLEVACCRRRSSRRLSTLSRMSAVSGRSSLMRTALKHYNERSEITLHTALLVDTVYTLTFFWECPRVPLESRRRLEVRRGARLEQSLPT